jgi:hypothetical protein
VKQTFQGHFQIEAKAGTHVSDVGQNRRNLLGRGGTCERSTKTGHFLFCFFNKFWREKICDFVTKMIVEIMANSVLTDRKSKNLMTQNGSHLKVQNGQI